MKTSADARPLPVAGRRLPGGARASLALRRSRPASVTVRRAPCPRGPGDRTGSGAVGGEASSRVYVGDASLPVQGRYERVPRRRPLPAVLPVRARPAVPRRSGDAGCTPAS